MSGTNDLKAIAGPQPGNARFYPAAEFFDWFMGNEAFQTGGRTVAERLGDLRNQESWEYEIFSVAGRTADDLKLHQAHVGRIHQAQDSLVATTGKVIVEALQDGVIVAAAYPSPASARRYLPRRLWHFLDLDFDKATASGAGLKFSGIGLAIWCHFTEDQREGISRRLDETERWLADLEAAVRKPTEAPPGYDPDRPLYVNAKIDPDTYGDVRRGRQVLAGAREGTFARENGKWRVSDDERNSWYSAAEEIWSKNNTLTATRVAELVKKHCKSEFTVRTIRKAISRVAPYHT